MNGKINKCVNTQLVICKNIIQEKFHEKVKRLGKKNIINK